MLKLYLVNCIQTKRQDKAKEFFDKLGPDLIGQAEWKDWFALPFIPSPDSHPIFAGFFSRHWQDSLMLTLFNFLSVIFACLPSPRLAQHRNAAAKIRRLMEENEALRQKLAAKQDSSFVAPSATSHAINIYPPDDVMDDFYIIAMQEGPSVKDDGAAKTLKSFLRNITGGGGGGSGSNSSNQSADASRRQQQNVVSGSLGARPSSVSSSLKAQQAKSRSSSKARVSSGSTTSATGATPTHAPVKRVAQSSSPSVPLVSTSPLPSSSVGLQTSSGTSGTRNPPAVPGGEAEVSTTEEKTEKLDYLLLGQEEYLEHHSEITHCRFTSSGLVVASSDMDGVVKVWTPSPAGPPQTQATFICQNSVTALEWIPNTDRHFLYGTRNGIVRLCDSAERRTINEVNFNKSNIGVIACSPSGSSCVVGLFNGSSSASSLLLYDVRTMTLEHDLSAETAVTSANSELTACVFNHNSQMCIASGTDGKVRIFDLRRRRGECISSWSVSEQPLPVLSLCLSQDETAVYALTSEGKFSGWSMYQSGQRIFEHPLNDLYYEQETVYPRHSWGRQFALAGSGKHILSCSTSGGVIYKFDGERLEKVLGLKGHRRHATCTDWSSANDCGPCVTAGFDGQIRLSTLLRQ